MKRAFLSLLLLAGAAAARAQTAPSRELALVPLDDALRRGEFAEGLRLGSATVDDFRGLFVSGRYGIRADPDRSAVVVQVLQEDEVRRFGYAELDFLFADSSGRRSLSRRAVLRQVLVPCEMDPDEMVRRFGREFLVLKAPPRAEEEPPWRIYHYPGLRLYLFYDGLPERSLGWYVEGLREIADQPHQPLRRIRRLLAGELPEARAQIEPAPAPARAYSTLSWPDSFLFYDEQPGFPDKDAKYWLMLSRAWDVKGDPRRSRESLEEGMKAFPSDPWLAFAAGERSRKDGRLDDAIEDYGRASSLSFPDGLADHRLGEVLAKQGRLEEAVEAYGRALKRYGLAERGLRAALLSERGRALYRLKRDAAFAADMELARSLDPTIEVPHFLLGEALARLGRLEEAAEEFRSAQRQSPRTSEAYWNLGVILEELGRGREALRNWEVFLDLETGPDRLAEARRRVERLRAALPAPRPALEPGTWERLLGPASERWSVVRSSSPLLLEATVERSPWAPALSSAPVAADTGPVTFELRADAGLADPRDAALRLAPAGRRAGAFRPLEAFLEEQGALPFGLLQEEPGPESSAGFPSRALIEKAAAELAAKDGVPVSSAAASISLALALPSPWFYLATAPALGPASMSWDGALMGVEEVRAPFGAAWAARVRTTLERDERLDERTWRIVRLVVYRWVSPKAPGLGVLKELRLREEASEVRAKGERLRGPFGPVSQETLSLEEWGEKK